MKLTKQQAIFLRRLNEDCDEAETLQQLHTSNARLDKYMDHLIKQGIASQDILEVLY